MNPLKSMMGQMNPMNLQQMAMDLLRQRNPQGYQQLQQLMQSGQDPKKITQQMMSNLSPQQKAQVEQMAHQFGIR